MSSSTAKKNAISSSITTHDHSFNPEKPRKLESGRNKNKNSTSSVKSLKNYAKHCQSRIVSPKFQIDSSFSSSILEEIRAFKEKKFQEYRKTLEKTNFSLPVKEKQPYVEKKREKIKEMNENVAQKRQEIRKKQEDEELARLEIAKKMKMQDLQEKYEKMKEKLRVKEKISENIRKNRENREISQEENKKKQLLMENIKNYYSDKIQELKEKLQNEKSKNEIIRNEQKALDSLIRQSRTQEENQ